MTQAEQAHTPTPWRLFDKNGVISIKATKTPDSKNEVVFWTGFDSSHFPEQARANAALIVEAVNSYAANKARIEALEKALREIVSTGTWSGTDGNTYTSDECRIARAALQSQVKP